MSPTQLTLTERRYFSVRGRRASQSSATWSIHASRSSDGSRGRSVRWSSGLQPRRPVHSVSRIRVLANTCIHPATLTNSLLVTFELTPSGSGIAVRMTETGFREMGWEAAVLEENFIDHTNGWDHYLPRLVDYVSQLTSTR